MTASGYTIKEVLKGLNLLMDCVQGAEKELKSQGHSQVFSLKMIIAGTSY